MTKSAEALDPTRSPKPPLVTPRASQAKAMARVGVPRPQRDQARPAQVPRVAQVETPIASPIAPMPILSLEPDAPTIQPAPPEPPPPDPPSPPRMSPSEPLATPAPLPTPDDSAAAAGPIRSSGSELAPITLPPQPVPLAPDRPVSCAETAGARTPSRRARQLITVSAAALLVLAASLGYRAFTTKQIDAIGPTSPSGTAHAETPPATVASAAAPKPITSTSTARADTAPPTVVSAAVPEPITQASAVAPPPDSAGAGAASAALHPLPAAPSQPAGSPVGEEAIPDYVSKPALLHLSALAIRRAERCHPHGHAVGTARVLVTFEQNGRVGTARIEGEPIASAPVSGCILGHAHAIKIPKFDGAPFTYALPITMR